MPSEIHDSYTFYEFTVSPSGEVWMLVNADPELMVVRFDSKGEMAGKTELAVSLDQINVTDFAALENDVLFLEGIGSGKKAGELSGHAFVGFFNGNTGKQILILRDILATRGRFGRR